MSEWSVRAFCPCGWSTKPSFGRVWFAQQDYPCCPQCGADCYGYELRTVRYRYEPTGEKRFFGLLNKHREVVEFKNDDGSITLLVPPTPSEVR